MAVQMNMTGWADGDCVAAIKRLGDGTIRRNECTSKNGIICFGLAPSVFSQRCSNRLVNWSVPIGTHAVGGRAQRQTVNN